MKRLVNFILLLLCFSIGHAQDFDNQITKGSVLQYKITEGSKEYNYTVTILKKADTTFSFKWITSERKPRKGQVNSNPVFFDLMARELLVKNFKTGTETLKSPQVRVFAPAYLKDMVGMAMMDPSKKQFDFAINNKAEKVRSNYPPVGPGKFLFNGKEVSGFSQEFVNATNDIYFSFTRCGTDGIGLLSFYKDNNFRMELVSIKLGE